MNKANWIKFKKQLPRNFDTEAANILVLQGLDVTPQFIRDVRRKKNNSPGAQQQVWHALHMVRNNHQKQLRRIKKLQEA